MRGQARITESNVQDMLREVRMALLEADVPLRRSVTMDDDGDESIRISIMQ
jgi:signal recognition particle GTPase